MEYNVSDLTRDVRVAIDMNMSSAPLSSLGDVDTLSLDEIIVSKIEDAARMVESGAPVYLLGSGEPFGASIGWDSEEGYGSGHIVLPQDFLRLVSYEMSDWSMAVTSVITEDDPLYARQRSRFPGIRGCPQKPVVAVVSRPVGLVLEFYSCTAGEGVYVKRARYIPVPKISGGKIDLPEKLRSAVVYETAYLTALSVGNGDVAAAMLNNAKELMQ